MLCCLSGSNKYAYTVPNLKMLEDKEIMMDQDLHIGALWWPDGVMYYWLQSVHEWFLSCLYTDQDPPHSTRAALKDQEDSTKKTRGSFSSSDISSSLLNHPSPSFLTADDLIQWGHIPPYFPPTPILTLHNCSSLSLSHFSPLSTEEILQIILSSNPTTYLVDTIPSTMLQNISQDPSPHHYYYILLHLVMFQLHSRLHSRIIPIQRNTLWIPQTSATTDQYQWFWWLQSSTLHRNCICGHYLEVSCC